MIFFAGSVCSIEVWAYTCSVFLCGCTCEIQRSVCDHKRNSSNFIQFFGVIENFNSVGILVLIIFMCIENRLKVSCAFNGTVYKRCNIYYENIQWIITIYIGKEAA